MEFSSNEILKLIERASGIPDFLSKKTDIELLLGKFQSVEEYLARFGSLDELVTFFKRFEESLQFFDVEDLSHYGGSQQVRWGEHIHLKGGGQKDAASSLYSARERISVLQGGSGDLAETVQESFTRGT